MSFALPYTISYVDKYPRPNLPNLNTVSSLRTPHTLWEIVRKYDSFREIVRIARMEDVLKDPQANFTVFVPLDLPWPREILQSCLGDEIAEKDVLGLNFNTARTIVDSLIIPGVLSTTMMMQSGFVRYKTRDNVNMLTIETQHCVQFEPETYNKPPFGVVLNGKARIFTPDIIASNGMVHVIGQLPYYLSI
ncbi:fasciclin-like protein [Chloriridovirus anopheles1]|uniref:Fasciclin-like protein n=1 Tax=Chloriridovirus anopheles1 TaxID=1465751 RepID=W8QRA8_9VIRU|nr:fasciclin-like protein [Anopheles minimus iridovirus]AHL67512.1 fasciclin-like protein [Anopheles minimus iridovirus]